MSVRGEFFHDDRRLVYTDFGEGARPLVLLPGLLLGRTLQFPLASALAEPMMASNCVTPINVSTNTAGASISVGSQPWGIAAAPVARSYFYVTQATRNSWSSPNSNEASITVG